MIVVITQNFRFLIWLSIFIFRILLVPHFFPVNPSTQLQVKSAMPSMHSPSFWQGLGEQLSMSIKRKIFILCPIFNFAIQLKASHFPHKAINFLIESMHTYFAVHSCKSNSASTSIWSNAVNTRSTILARVWFAIIDICINEMLVRLSWNVMLLLGITLSDLDKSLCWCIIFQTILTLFTVFSRKSSSTIAGIIVNLINACCTVLARMGGTFVNIYKNEILDLNPCF